MLCEEPFSDSSSLCSVTMFKSSNVLSAIILIFCNKIF